MKKHRIATPTVVIIIISHLPSILNFEVRLHAWSNTDYYRKILIQMIQWNLENPTLNWSHNYMSFQIAIYRISDVSECNQIIDDVKVLDCGGSM